MANYSKKPNPIQKNLSPKNQNIPKNKSNNNNNNNPPPSPWLDENISNNFPDQTASFVEYIRWMREPNSEYKDPTKTQILQLATEQSNYDQRLKEMNRRLTLMVGKNNTFQVKSSWRIRIGGHRGAENILLPAFDNLGIPFIPSASLKGVARNQAIRELMKKENIDYKKAEKHPEISKYFGNLDANNNQNKAGQIIFFDAYPLPKKDGLTMDIANNIWSWDQNNNLEYKPNPNVFLSLKEPTFLIGLKLVNNLTDNQLLEKVKTWLIKGLETGIGSQINTGYGQLITAGTGNITNNNEILRLNLSLEGQLIHGYQKFTQWTFNNNRQQWQMRGKAEPEVRPIAFKSMLRYWFRVFSLGVLPVQTVQKWEGKLFGSINPQQYHGYIKCNLLESRLLQSEARNKTDKCGEQSAIFTLNFSSEIPFSEQNTVNKLIKNLTWIMLNIGGMGQGSRRPCYSRQNRQYAPWWRGSTIYLENEDDFWLIGDTAENFQVQFRRRLTDFYESLGQLIGQKINYKNPRNTGSVTDRNWTEAIDINSRIIVCSGDKNFNKPYALSILHSEKLKHNGDYDGNLCGYTRGNKVKPSPVWIADLGDYQIVTVFGATENPRQKYLQELRNKAENCVQIFPFQ